MSDSEIISSRVFNVSRGRLFGAFADPGQLAEWWGPQGFTNTIHEFDLRPGGKWRLTLHGPDGTDYENDKTFTEVVPGEKVTFRHHAPVHGFVMEHTYSDEAQGTRLHWLMCFDDPAEMEKIRDFIAKANEQNFDRLQAYLDQNP
jgi:uncharacterized protein YndB with AHSA1/START domain